MARKVVSLEEATYAVTAAHSAVWRAIAGFRYMWDAHEEGAPFELTIFEILLPRNPLQASRSTGGIRSTQSSCANASRKW